MKHCTGTHLPNGTPTRQQRSPEKPPARPPNAYLARTVSVTTPSFVRCPSCLWGISGSRKEPEATWEQTSPPVGRRLRKGTLPIAAYTRNPNDFSYVRMLPKVGFGKNLSNTQLRVGPNGSKHRPQWHICCAMMPCRTQLFQETQMILHTFGCNRKSVLLKTQLILQTFGWGVNFRFHR